MIGYWRKRSIQLLVMVEWSCLIQIYNAEWSWTKITFLLQLFEYNEDLCLISADHGWLQRKTQDNINYCGLLVTLYMLCMVNAIESWTCIPDTWLICITFIQLCVLLTCHLNMSYTNLCYATYSNLLSFHIRNRWKKYVFKETIPLSYIL